jgi:acyl-CoA thioesterase FadM
VYPWLRLVQAGWRAFSADNVSLLTTTRIRLRVWPNDLDFNLHVNNGRYLTLADIARIDWFARTGMLAAARRQRAFPVVGDVIAKFRRDLRAFQSFEICTRLLGWDSKWGFLEHRFVRGGRVLGTVTVRGAFKGPTGMIDPATLLQPLSHGAPSPLLPESVRQFQICSDLSSEVLRAQEREQGLRGADPVAPVAGD